MELERLLGPCDLAGSPHGSCGQSRCPGPGQMILDRAVDSSVVDFPVVDFPVVDFPVVDFP